MPHGEASGLRGKERGRVGVESRDTFVGIGVRVMGGEGGSRLDELRHRDRNE